MTDVLTPGDGKSPWTNSLPLKWPSKPLKYLVSIDSRKLPENTRPEEVLRYIDIGAVNALGEIQEIEVTLFENAPSRARRLPVRGDSIISTVRTYLRAIAYIGNTEGEGRLVCSTGFAVLSPAKFVHPKFLYYCVRSSGLIEELVARSTGVSYPAISPSGFSALPLPLPPFQLQRVIADFLDRKTAAIDELIRKKERLIELLAEKRQALITQAVTKGLDPNVPVKDSGIEWLSEIPAHWEVTAVKRLARDGRRTFTDGDWIEAPYITESGVRLIQTGNVGVGEYREKGFRFVSDDTFRDLKCTEVNAGDILICRLDGPVGRACLAPCLGDQMITSVDNAILKVAIGHDSRFVVYSLSSERYLKWVQVLCRVGGGHRFRVSRSMLGAVHLPVPPSAEQKHIAEVLDQMSTEIGRVMSTVAAQVVSLGEYRQALISAAVTGQLDILAEPTP